MLAVLAVLTVATPTSCGTPDHHRDIVPHNYIFFGRDRERIADTVFLSDPHIIGAQLTYTWRELEATPDHYEFGAVRQDLAFLKAHGKRLFLQLQDVSFSETVVTPDYLRSDPAYHGGIARKYEAGAGDSAQFDGWVARRWDPAVRDRFARLLRALAREFDGSIEGVVLPETAIGFEGPKPPSCPMGRCRGQVTAFSGGCTHTRNRSAWASGGPTSCRIVPSSGATVSR